jgi:hypothetical protein
MRFLELLKRPDSGHRANRNDPRLEINDGSKMTLGEGYEMMVLK